MARLGAMIGIGVVALATATPASAIRVPEPAPREASAAELMTAAAHDRAAAAPSTTVFDEAIARYHAGTAWIGLPDLDASSFVMGFLKGAALLAALCLISQRRLFLRGGPRRS